MGGYDQQLLDLRKQAKRAEKIRELLDMMQKQYRSLEFEVSRTRRKHREEQDDVDRMRGGITGILSKLSGGYREQMNKEVEECLEASMEYEEAVKAFRTLQEQRDAYRAELEELLPFEEAYRTRIRTLAEELKASGTPQGTRLIVLEEELQQNREQQELLRWALKECDYLLNMVSNSHFDEAYKKHQQENLTAAMGISPSHGRHHRSRRYYEELRREQRLEEQTESQNLELRFAALRRKMEEKGVALQEAGVMPGCSLGELRTHLYHMKDEIQQQLDTAAVQEQSLQEQTDDCLLGNTAV